MFCSQCGQEFRYALFGLMHERDCGKVKGESAMASNKKLNERTPTFTFECPCCLDTEAVTNEQAVHIRAGDVWSCAKCDNDVTFVTLRDNQYEALREINGILNPTPEGTNYSDRI